MKISNYGVTLLFVGALLTVKADGAISNVKAISDKDAKVTSCTTTERTYQTKDPAIFDSIEINNSRFGTTSEHLRLDRDQSVTVNSLSKICSTGSLSTLDAGQYSATSNEGDTRTITQTKNNIKSTYKQTYVKEKWATVRLSHTVVSISPAEPGARFGL